MELRDFGFGVRCLIGKRERLKAVQKPIAFQEFADERARCQRGIGDNPQRILRAEPFQHRLNMRYQTRR